jgi:ribonucleoside-triphosphate reductase
MDIKKEFMSISTRAKVITRRTYNRPLDDSGKKFESWEQTVDRVIGHQQWLWERAKGSDLNELERLMLDRKVLTSGRTLWLGGTDVSKTREASQFNCSFTEVETVYDVVDILWLLLQGKPKHCPV